MQQRLARLDSARKEFIANASHELRTPIFSLGGFVELLDEDEPDPAVRGRWARDDVALESVARQVAREFVPAAERHRSALRVEGMDAAVALADADRVAQIIRILLDNALTHTPEETSITITAQRRDGAPSLVIADDGPGIAPHDHNRILDRFYTGDRVSGSGLGLAIARELAVRMNGELSVESRRGHTQFELKLPAAVGVPA